MRSIVAVLLLLLIAAAHAAGSAQAALQKRCVAAIADSGQAANLEALKQTTIPLGDSGFLFQFAPPSATRAGLKSAAETFARAGRTA
jgi:hypothetical protein